MTEQKNQKLDDKNNLKVTRQNKKQEIAKADDKPMEKTESSKEKPVETPKEKVEQIKKSAPQIVSKYTWSKFTDRWVNIIRRV